MARPKMPKMKKSKSLPGMGKLNRPGGKFTAFGAGGKQAFSDPGTMVSPNLAFGPATAQQGLPAPLPGPAPGE